MAIAFSLVGFPVVEAFDFGDTVGVVDAVDLFGRPFGFGDSFPFFIAFSFFLCSVASFDARIISPRVPSSPSVSVVES